MTIEPFTRTRIDGYDAMIQAIRARLDELQMSHKTFDRLAGWAEGYTGKIVGDARAKILSFESLWFVLDALAIRLELVPDAELLARMEGKYEECVVNKRILHNTSRPLSKKAITRVASQTGAMGKDKRKTFRITPQQVAEQRSNASKSRWKKYHARQREERKAQRTQQERPAAVAVLSAPPAG